MKIGNIIYSLLIVLIIGGSCFMAYYTWTLGSDEDDYETICLGNHEYYRANFAAKMAVAIKLNDDGKPTKCEEE